MRVFIMRGIPGSGKTTWAKGRREGYILSADDAMMENNIYRFDPTKLPMAHDWVLRRFTDFIHDCGGYKHNPSTLIVDNTNIQAWEIAPYYRLAEAFGLSPTIVWVHCDPAIAVTRNNGHNVPPEVIHRMARSFDPLPAHWNIQHVYN